MSINNTPMKNNDQKPTLSIKISPVKVPPGAKQINNYILGKALGAGTFGKVHLGLHIPTGQKVAVKIIDKTKLSNKDLERINREIQILKKTMHPHIIQLYEIIETEKSLLFVEEYVENGELFNYIIQRKKLAQNQARKFFHQIIEGVQYMHKLGIAHRDLKPQNILIDSNHNIKIIDFGLSNMYKKNQKLKTQCGSPCYAAPQMIEGKCSYDPLMIDIWSAGVVLFAMLAGYLPFCDHDTSKLFKKILLGSYTCPSWLSNDAKDLIQKILTTNPLKRSTLADIIEHPWYQHENGKRSVGIDTRFYKIPIQMTIISTIQKLGINVEPITESVQKSKKNKQAALYYILGKKLVKQKYPMQNFMGSDNFEYKSLELKVPNEDQSQNADSSTFIVPVQQVSPIPVQQVALVKAPQSNAPCQIQMLQSTNLQTAVHQIMNQQQETDEIKQIGKKVVFYGLNLQIGKRFENFNKSQISVKHDKQRYHSLQKGKSMQNEKIMNMFKAYKKLPGLFVDSSNHNMHLPEISRKKTKESIESRKTAATTETISVLDALKKKKEMIQKLIPNFQVQANRQKKQKLIKLTF